MGGGDFHRKKQSQVDVPKGWVAVKVGAGDEELERIIIPVVHFNHPLFLQLLKEAEEEFGFEHKGTIAIPCHVHQFRSVQRMIDKDYHRHLVACFRVLN